MSQERDVILVKENGGVESITASEAREIAKDDVELTRAQKKAMLIEVLERGFTSVRLQVDLPDDLYGEWVAKDIDSITRMQRMGFHVDKEYSKPRALHGEGDSLPQIGDTIFMVTTKEQKELIDEVQAELYKRRHLPEKKKKGSSQEEDTAFSTEVEAKLGMPVIEESSTRVAKKADIEAAMTKI